MTIRRKKIPEVWYFYHTVFCLTNWIIKCVRFWGRSPYLLSINAFNNAKLGILSQFPTTSFLPSVCVCVLLSPTGGLLAVPLASALFNPTHVCPFPLRLRHLPTSWFLLYLIVTGTGDRINKMECQASNNYAPVSIMQVASVCASIRPRSDVPSMMPKLPCEKHWQIELNAQKYPTAGNPVFFC